MAKERNRRAELARIIINEASDQQVIVLKECGRRRQLPIVIGIAEVVAIDRRVKGSPAPRPMTHDLLDNIMECLGARIQKIVINDLRKHTFYAKIFLKKGERTIEIDSRPSDAIALAVRSKADIYVAEEVFRKAGQE
jgi:bifunctional DNase/RNase